MKHNNKGFSLIELLVSIAILAVIMVMVVQFMGTASVSLRKTRKQMDVQTGALEFREQLSDIMMQATYVRIETTDAKGYELDTSLENANYNKKRKRVDSTDTNIVKAVDLGANTSSLSKLTLVSDSFPDYLKSGSKDLDIYIDQDDYTLLGRDPADRTKEYSAAKVSNIVDELGVSSANEIRSFRLLSNGSTNDESYYVKPEYIYIRYQPKYDSTVVLGEFNGTTGNTILTEEYVIYRFDGKQLYVYKGDVSNPATSENDGFVAAKNALAANTGVGKVYSDEDYHKGLMVDLVKEVFVSVNTEANNMRFSLQLYDSDQQKSKRDEDDSGISKYIYDYEDSIVLRNSNSLTVSANKLYKRKDTTKSSTPSSEETSSEETSSEETTP